MRLKEKMMHANAHFFTPKTEREIALANHTVAHIASEVARRPSDATVDQLKTKLGAKKARWDEWILEKKHPLPTEPP